MWYDSEITQGILKRKYLHDDESTFEEFVDRVTSIYSKSVSQRLKKAMYNQEFCPAGRILYGAGAKGKFRATTSNCFILDKPEDSIESIYETNKKMARIFSYGGGCGLNISNLRPKGAKVHNSAGSSTGAVSFLNIFNETGNVIGSNGRRAAILVGLECSHPDIYEYLHIKENDEKLESMNISILFTDEFMEAVEQDKEYTLKFDVKATGEHIERTIRARDFFKEYCEVNKDYGDPGALFIDTARRDQLLSGYKEYKIDISNPCAEYLGNAYNSCLLSSINLYSAIDDKFTDKANVNHKRLEKLTRLGIDELDETLDYGLDVLPLQENKDCAKEWRSIGLGVFGLGDALVALGIKYGSKESLQIVDDMFETIFLTALDESANLARRKGTFPKYDWNKTKQSPFIKGIEFAYPTLYNKIKRYGLRNGTLLSIAPSGTISLFMGSFTGGCEPLFKLFYERTTHSMENKHQTFRVYAASIHDLVKFHNLPEDISIEELKDRFPFLVESHDVDPIDRVHMQEIIQNYVDNAVSSTVNLPEGTGADTIYKIYMEAWKSKCKGITVFVDGCKRGNILGVKKDDKKKSENDGNDRLEVVDNDFITPKYNTVLPAKRRNKGIVSGYTLKESTACVPQMYVTVNTDDDDVYEVFTNASTGCRANINTITRLISLALRSGIKVDKIIEELRANQCPACQTLIKQGRKVSLSCANAMADAIEIAIKNNKRNNTTTPLVKEETETTKIEDKKNDSELLECPECHNKTLKPEAKCCVCSVCGYSKCE